MTKLLNLKVFWRLFCECSPHYLCWLRDIARKTIWCWTKSKSYFFLCLVAHGSEQKFCSLPPLPLLIRRCFCVSFLFHLIQKVREHNGLFWGNFWAVLDSSSAYFLASKTGQKIPQNSPLCSRTFLDQME